jgi:hypothetical protein
VRLESSGDRGAMSRMGTGWWLWFGAGLWQAAAVFGLGAEPAEPCWRAREGSTFQDWAFKSPANPIAPEVSSNAYGLAEASVVPGFMASGWLRDIGLGTQTGYWDLGSNGLITVSIPDRLGLGTEAWKYVSVQVVYWEDPPLFVGPSVAVFGATMLTRTNWVVENTGLGTWRGEWSLWRLGSNLVPTMVVISAGPNGGVVDRVGVDTWVLDLPRSIDLVLAADPGQCSRSNVIYPALPVADGCPVTNVTCTPPSGATLPVGVSAVSCSMIDAWGAGHHWSFAVRVDDVAPDRWRLNVRRLSPPEQGLEICWPASCVPPVLEENSDLTSPDGWQPVGASAQCGGDRCWVIVQPVQGPRFFRLRRF